MKALDTIKSRGYWRVSVEPKKYETHFEGVLECMKAIQKSQISAGGWDYPFLPNQKTDDMGYGPGDNFYQGWISADDYQEFWRLYQSGQFILYEGLHEDWLEKRQIQNWGKAIALVPGKFLGVSRTIFFLTRTFAFISKLIASGLFKDGIKISISLNNTEGRELLVDSSGRIGFSFSRSTEDKKLEFIKIYTPEEINENVFESSLEAIKYFFERFNWIGLPLDSIHKDQIEVLN